MLTAFEYGYMVGSTDEVRIVHRCVERTDLRVPYSAGRLWVLTLVSAVSLALAQATGGVSIALLPLMIATLRNRPLLRVFVCSIVLGPLLLPWFIGLYSAMSRC